MKRFDRRPITRSARRMLRVLAALAIGCKFLVPIGYMPGSFANGTPFVLCDMYGATPGQHEAHSMSAEMSPDMSPSMSDSAMPGSGMAEHEEHVGAEAWEHCPLGALGSGAAMAFGIEPVVDSTGSDQISDFPTATPRSISILAARARAPPVTANQLTA